MSQLTTTLDTERLSTEAACRTLGINEQTLYGWQVGCPFLDGAPLIPVAVKSPVHGRWGKTWDNIQRIKKERASARKGIYHDLTGLTWWSTARAVQELSRVRRRFSRRTLELWRTRGCPHLGGRKLRGEQKNLGDGGTPSYWYVADDILACRDSLASVAVGHYGTPDNQWMTPTAVEKALGCTRRTLLKWERQGLLEPHFFAGKHGGGKSKQKRTYRLADVKARIDSLRTPFDGYYDDGTRVNVKRAAEMLETSQPTVSRLIRKGELLSEARKRPWSGEEATILVEDIQRFKATRHAQQNAGPPSADWQTVAEILAAHQIEPAAQYMARVGLRALREQHPDLARQCPQPMHTNQGGMRDVWFYEPVRLLAVLAGRTLVEAGASVPVTECAKTEPDESDPSRPPASLDEIRAARKRRGRRRGSIDPEVAERRHKMLEAWDRGDFDGNKTAASKAHGFHRSDATKIINAHEKAKRENAKSTM